MISDPPILEYSSPLGDGPPPGCRVQIERHEDGVTFTDPPIGLASIAGTVFGLLVLGVVMGVVSIAMFYDALRDGRFHFDNFIPLIVFPLLAILSLTGVAFVICDALAPVELIARDGKLTVRRGKGIRARSKTFRYDQVRRVATGIQGATMKFQPIGTLSITPELGISTIFLFQRRNMIELKWIARILNQTMQKGDEKKHRSFRLS